MVKKIVNHIKKMEVWVNLSKAINNIIIQYKKLFLQIILKIKINKKVNI